MPYAHSNTMLIAIAALNRNTDQIKRYGGSRHIIMASTLVEKPMPVINEMFIAVDWSTKVTVIQILMT